MHNQLTEDKVRDLAREILGLKDNDHVLSGVGQITTFNQLGFPGISDKPDGWYLPKNHNDVALILETKSSKTKLGKSQINELLKKRGEIDNIQFGGKISSELLLPKILQIV